jgi:hypothetical protein
MHGYLGGNAGNVLTSDGWLNTRDRVELQGDRVLFLGQDSVINVGGAGPAGGSGGRRRRLDRCSRAEEQPSEGQLFALSWSGT